MLGAAVHSWSSAVRLQALGVAVHSLEFGGTAPSAREEIRMGTTVDRHRRPEAGSGEWWVLIYVMFVEFEW